MKIGLARHPGGEFPKPARAFYKGLSITCSANRRYELETFVSRAAHQVMNPSQPVLRRVTCGPSPQTKCAAVSLQPPEPSASKTTVVTERREMMRAEGVVLEYVMSDQA